MTSLYYYIISSLPYISMDSSDFSFSYEEFLETCRSALSEDDFIKLEAVKLNFFGDVESSFLSNWILYEKSLRNTLVDLRNNDLNFEENYKRESLEVFNATIDAKNAYSKSSLLEAEFFLDECRFKYLNDMEAGVFFTFENLISYSLKLEILNRRKSFNKEIGSVNFDKIYQAVSDKIAH